MKIWLLALIGTLAIAGGTARMQEPSKKPDMHSMMADQQKMMMSMHASDKKLDDLLSQLNAAKGNDRIDKLVAVVNELAAERKDMHGMMSMHGGMMNMMANEKKTDK
jgi:hypothetical protein